MDSDDFFEMWAFQVCTFIMTTIFCPQHDLIISFFFSFNMDIVVYATYTFWLSCHSATDVLPWDHVRQKEDYPRGYTNSVEIDHCQYPSDPNNKCEFGNRESQCGITFPPSRRDLLLSCWQQCCGPVRMYLYGLLSMNSWWFSPTPDNHHCHCSLRCLDPHVIPMPIPLTTLLHFLQYASSLHSSDKWKAPKSTISGQAF